MGVPPYVTFLGSIRTQLRGSRPCCCPSPLDLVNERLDPRPWPDGPVIATIGLYLKARA
jgi:hypothetical protein